MPQDENSKRYDLEDRTFSFAQCCRALVKNLPRTIGNSEDGRQLVRSSGSVGAYYIEANEALSKKDFVCRIKICRKEAKESRYWLRLLDAAASAITERDKLIQEAQELTNIFRRDRTKGRIARSFGSFLLPEFGHCFGFRNSSFEISSPSCFFKC